MKMLKVASMLMACYQAVELEKDLGDREVKLSQSFASAFNMEPPKLMTTKELPQGSQEVCPKPGQMLTNTKSGGAFLDGCYMNTTRSQQRNEATGEEAQSYLYMWKHACAFTKWVPSNQFMYSNLDYDASTMTLERFGFIGMDKRCFWGSIGVLWKRPLPVDQILPNTTVEVDMPKQKEVEKPKQKEVEKPKQKEVEKPKQKEHVYLIVVGSKVALRTSDLAETQDYLKEQFKADVNKPSRMVVEFIDGQMVDDPHQIGPDAIKQNPSGGFNKFWWDWSDIGKMQKIAKAAF